MALSDVDLIIKAQNGETAAFEELVFRYDRRVLSMALRYVQDSDDAMDIYQEVFIRVYRSLKNFKFKSEFSTWLYRITTNVCLTFKSKSKKKFQVSMSEYLDDESSETNIPDEETKEPYQSALRSEIGHHINKALNTLPPKQKLVFVLKHYEGYKIREIAEMMNCKEGTVKKYLFEAVHKLRKLLEFVYV